MARNLMTITIERGDAEALLKCFERELIKGNSANRIRDSIEKAFQHEDVDDTSRYIDLDADVPMISSDEERK